MAIISSFLLLYGIVALPTVRRLIDKVRLSLPWSPAGDYSPTCSDAPDPVIMIRGMRNVLAGSMKDSSCLLILH